MIVILNSFALCRRVPKYQILSGRQRFENPLVRNIEMFGAVLALVDTIRWRRYAGDRLLFCIIMTAVECCPWCRTQRGVKRLMPGSMEQLTQRCVRKPSSHVGLRLRP